MQFKRAMLNLVMSGEKTRTWRLKEPRYKVGSIQAVQCGYRDKAHGHIKINDIQRQKVGDVTQSQAEAEGFISPFAFVGYVIDINPANRIMPDTEGWSIEFELVEADHD